MIESFEIRSKRGVHTFGVWSVRDGGDSVSYQSEGLPTIHIATSGIDGYSCVSNIVDCVPGFGATPQEAYDDLCRIMYGVIRTLHAVCDI